MKVTAAIDVKILDQVSQDMRTLYDELRAGEVEIKLADSLANVAGKNLKAQQLKLAHAIFQNDLAARGALPPGAAKALTADES